ncbi:hypothetical protein DFH27DRAFT_616692 [Peziza echinospora]|nr:hypothetical protein DFH27DRAFT_616692 [Peziza echinospora]
MDDATVWDPLRTHYEYRMPHSLGQEILASLHREVLQVALDAGARGAHAPLIDTLCQQRMYAIRLRLRHTHIPIANMTTAISKARFLRFVHEHLCELLLGEEEGRGLEEQGRGLRGAVARGARAWLDRAPERAGMRRWLDLEAEVEGGRRRRPRGDPVDEEYSAIPRLLWRMYKNAGEAVALAERDAAERRLEEAQREAVVARAAAALAERRRVQEAEAARLWREEQAELARAHRVAVEARRREAAEARRRELRRQELMAEALALWEREQGIRDELAALNHM